MGIGKRLFNIIRAEINSVIQKGKKKVRESDLLKEDLDPDKIDIEAEWEQLKQEVAKTVRAKHPLIESCYKQLQLPYGADLDTVTKRYKNIMKEFHPDRFPEPELKKKAAEVIGKISKAYHELKKYLEKK